MNKYYFDTCTIIDSIDNLSPFNKKVVCAIAQIRGLHVFSEYMEIELKSVLRHAEKFYERKDEMLNNYIKIKQSSNVKFIPINQQILSLHHSCMRQRIYPLKFQDMVHIGICGLESIPNIISDDWHIHGHVGTDRPFIEKVRTALHFNDPKHAFTTRSGYLKMEV